MNEPARRSDDLSEISRWVCFELAGQNYGLPILNVQEVLEGAQIEPVPGASPQVLGVINLRGNVVTVIDLRSRLGMAPQEAVQSEANRIVIVDHGEEAIGLRVDRIADVRKISGRAIKPPPDTGAGLQKSQIRGVVSRDGEFLTLLNVKDLLDQTRFMS